MATRIETEVCYKMTRASGADFRTGTIDYAAALRDGKAVEVLDAEPATGSVCGHGIHVSPTARQTIQFGNRDYRPYRWFEGIVIVADIIERDKEKLRVRRFTPTKELSLSDIFGADIGERVAAVRESIVQWATIPWLKPKKAVTDEQVAALVNEWREALSPWLKDKRKLPAKVMIVRSAAAADAAAAAAAADAADAAAAADAADAAAADADAAADAAAAAAAAFRRWPWYRWYVRPYDVLRRDALWRIAGMPGASPWKPLIELYQIGCMPIGYVRGEFVVYAPPVKAGAKRKKQLA